MTRRDLVSIGTWSAGAFGLAMALAVPVSLHATGPTTRPQIATPTLNVNGAALSIRAVNGNLQPGQKPQLEVVAVNNGTTEAQVQYALQLQSLAPDRESMSRVAMPRTLHRQAEQTLALKPGEKRVIKIEPQTQLPAGREVNVVLSSANKRINAATINVAPQNPKP